MNNSINNHLSNLYSKHSDDEYGEEQSTKNTKITSCKSKSKLSRKYKKYTPPKHIQQKIELHKAIKSISSTKKIGETDSKKRNKTKSKLKRNNKTNKNNNNKKKRRYSSNNNNNNTNDNIMNTNTSKMMNDPLIIQTNKNLLQSHLCNFNVESPLEYDNDTPFNIMSVLTQTCSQGMSLCEL